jgi:nucleotide-binding universal stress UspA family protein
MYKRIVVPLDGSKLAEEVLAHVRALASCLGSEIMLVRVTTYPSYDYLMADPSAAASLQTSLEGEASEYLEDLVDSLHRAGFQAQAEVVTVGGPVADAIITYAHKVQADLIAMSTHGRTGPSRWFLGSVADRVVRGAGVPVLMIRPVKHE